MPQFDIGLDLKKRDTAPSKSVAVRVGDKGTQKVRAELSDGSAEYTVPAGTTATVEVLRSDGLLVTGPAEVDTVNSVRAVLPDEAMAAPGYCRFAYFALRYANGTVATTEGFVLKVLDGAGAHAGEAAEPYVDEFERLLALYRQRLADATAAAESAATMAGQAGGAANEAALRATLAAEVIEEGPIEYDSLSADCRAAIAASAASGVVLATPAEVDAAFDSEIAPMIVSRTAPPLTDAQLDDAVREILA